jgi:outer membrane protein assembly factor BamB
LIPLINAKARFAKTERRALSNGCSDAFIKPMRRRHEHWSGTWNLIRCHLTAVYQPLFLLLAALSCCAQQPGTVKWRLNLSSAQGFGFVSSPALAPDGTIYVGTGQRGSPSSPSGTFFYSISPGGKTNWSRILTGVNYSAPAISPDGIVYVPCQFQIPFAARLNALTPSGNTNWSFKTSGGSISAPALGVDGTIYVVASGPPNILFSIRPDGGTNWMCSLGPSTNASASAQFPGPAIGPDGTIYVGSLDTNVYAISPQGKTNWIFRMEDKTFSSPAIGTDGTIYIGSDDQKLYALGLVGTKSGNTSFRLLSKVPRLSARTGQPTPAPWAELPGSTLAEICSGQIRAFVPPHRQWLQMARFTLLISTLCARGTPPARISGAW